VCRLQNEFFCEFITPFIFAFPIFEKEEMGFSTLQNKKSRHSHVRICVKVLQNGEDHLFSALGHPKKQTNWIVCDLFLTTS